VSSAAGFSKKGKLTFSYFAVQEPAPALEPQPLSQFALDPFWLPDVGLVASPQVTDEGLPSIDMTVHQPVSADLNSVMAGLPRSPFDPIEEFKNEYRCIYADLRNANAGESSGPLEIDRPWDSYADDHLGLMDHLGIDKFMVLGFCIGGPFIWNLLKRAPNRVVAAVPVQPVGFRPELPNVMYDGSLTRWGPDLIKRRPDITTEMVEKFATRMFRTNADFVFTVSRDFVRSCQTPVLILPDDVPSHPYAVAMECAMLAPKAEVSMYPWKEPKERIPLAVRQVRSFLRAHRAGFRLLNAHRRDGPSHEASSTLRVWPMLLQLCAVPTNHDF
jgi:pimeloyl-ACP methyl ester carboxylesterase